MKQKSTTVEDIAGATTDELEKEVKQLKKRVSRLMNIWTIVGVPNITVEVRKPKKKRTLKK